MKKSFWMIPAAVVVIMTVGCHFWIEVPVETTVRALNDLTDLEVTVNGVTSEVPNIDLDQVIIGDVVFSYISAGTVTEYREIGQSGTVDVSIGSATAEVALIGIGGLVVYQDFTFYDIDPMETDIEEGEDNTVIFDEETAGVVFSALAKRRDQK